MSENQRIPSVQACVRREGRSYFVRLDSDICRVRECRVYSTVQQHNKSGETSEWTAICTFPALRRGRIEKERLATERISRPSESQKGSLNRRVAQ